MLFDTDVLIWGLRGNAKAARAVDGCDQRAVSVVTYMELLQGARNKAEIRAIEAFLADIRFTAIPLTENIGHRASIYMEEYVLADSLSRADALIAATAIEAQQPLISGNTEHYKAIQDLVACLGNPDPDDMKVYCPEGKETFDDDETAEEAPS